MIINLRNNQNKNQLRNNQKWQVTIERGTNKKSTKNKNKKHFYKCGVLLNHHYVGSQYFKFLIVTPQSMCTLKRYGVSIKVPGFGEQVAIHKDTGTANVTDLWRVNHKRHQPIHHTHSPTKQVQNSMEYSNHANLEMTTNLAKTRHRVSSMTPTTEHVCSCAWI